MGREKKRDIKLELTSSLERVQVDIFIEGRGKVQNGKVESTEREGVRQVQKIRKQMKRTEGRIKVVEPETRILNKKIK